MMRVLCRLTTHLTLTLLVVLSAAAQGPKPSALFDQDLALINAELPGFGGMFYDEEGVLNVYMVEDNFNKRGVSELFGEEVKIITGRYEIKQLQAWHDAMLDILGQPSVVLLDVDERLNRIRVGVERNTPKKRATRSALEKKVSEFQVPAAAVVFEEVDPIYQMTHTLSSAFNPVPGGVEINFPGFLCTLGFNVRGQTGPCYFMTNSHCTSVQGGVESTPYLQPAGGASIGTEIYDPTYFSGSPCPAGRVCRFSDSAGAIYNSPSLCEFGAIARTTGLGSVTINHSQPRWQIVSKLAVQPTVGIHVSKTGRTTGWSSGRIAASCVDVNVSGTNITQLCQSLVNAAVGGGDSGSPVFRPSLDSSQAELYGILWGGNSGGTQFVFSPMPNIEFEVGGPLPVF